ncbi:hypothetical protein [Bacillus cereus group sp. MYBK95-2]|uniref:hypothetical protein n=1 Tax=Bacillus cereus group sp. MYBK95-2 TaxID=3450599 RepID=UPI003F7A7EFF
MYYNPYAKAKHLNYTLQPVGPAEVDRFREQWVDLIFADASGTYNLTAFIIRFTDSNNVLVLLCPNLSVTNIDISKVFGIGPTQTQPKC